MDGVSSLGAGVVAWTDTSGDKPCVRVRDLKRGETRLLDAYVGFGLRDLSPDGERLAIVGPWAQKRNNNVSELVVLDWRTDNRVFASADHLYYRALFDATGQRVLVESYNKPNRCIDLATGEVIGETKDKHVGLYPMLRDRKRNGVWLPLAKGRRKARAFWDFATSSSRDAPAVVDAVSPAGDRYRIDEHVTRLGDDGEAVWSIAASEPSGQMRLVPKIAFCGADDRLLYEQPDPAGGWGVIHVVDAATGMVLARRQRVQGESFELPWPGRFICDPTRARMFSLDDLAWRPLPEAPHET